MKSLGIALHRLFSHFAAALAPHALLGPLEQLLLSPASSPPSPSLLWPLKKCHVTGLSVQTSPPFQVQDKTHFQQAIHTCPLSTGELQHPPSLYSFHPFNPLPSSLRSSPLSPPILCPSPPSLADLGTELAMLGKHCPIGLHP